MTLFKHTKHPHVPRNINVTHAAEQTGFNQRLAVMITRSFGSMWAFYILIAWMLLWMALSSLGLWLFALDRYPFAFLLFLSNLVQLWALPVLSVGQNVLSRKAELQADETYATTTKMYHDIEQIAQHLSAQDEVLARIAEKDKEAQ
jgi:uncharacterized membrane protein